MICQECKRSVKQINVKHLQKCSGLTPTEYKTKWHTSLFDDDIKLKCSNKMEKNGMWKNGISYQKHYCTKCGGYRCARSSSKLCKHCCKIGIGNPFYNKKHTVNTRKKMVESNKTRDKSTYHRIIQSAEQRLKCSERMKKLHKEGKFNLDNFIAAGQNNCKKQKCTKIENIIYSALTKIGIQNLNRNVQIGHYNADLLINTLIIECYGDYWHCNPRIFKKTDYNKSLKMTANTKWLNDKIKQTNLENKGYQYLYFWEYDIYNNLNNVIKEICKHFNLQNLKCQ